MNEKKVSKRSISERTATDIKDFIRKHKLVRNDKSVRFISDEVSENTNIIRDKLNELFVDKKTKSYQSLHQSLDRLEQTLNVIYLSYDYNDFRILMDNISLEIKNTIIKLFRTQEDNPNLIDINTSIKNITNYFNGVTISLIILRKYTSLAFFIWPRIIRNTYEYYFKYPDIKFFIRHLLWVASKTKKVLDRIYDSYNNEEISKKYAHRFIDKLDQTLELVPENKRINFIVDVLEQSLKTQHIEDLLNIIDSCAKSYS
jgi:hypothetical protein